MCGVGSVSVGRAGVLLSMCAAATQARPMFGKNIALRYNTSVGRPRFLSRRERPLPPHSLRWRRQRPSYCEVEPDPTCFMPCRTRPSPTPSSSPPLASEHTPRGAKSSRVQHILCLVVWDPPRPPTPLPSSESDRRVVGRSGGTMSQVDECHR